MDCGLGLVVAMVGDVGVLDVVSGLGVGGRVGGGMVDGLGNGVVVFGTWTG